MTRRCTTLAPYDVRKAAWEAAVSSAEKHTKLGITLQGQGVEILKKTFDASPEVMSKLIQQATITIEKGVALEREAKDKLLDLYQQEPREA